MDAEHRADSRRDGLMERARRRDGKGEVVASAGHSPYRIEMSEDKLSKFRSRWQQAGPTGRRLGHRRSWRRSCEQAWTIKRQTGYTVFYAGRAFLTSFFCISRSRGRVGP